MSSHITLHPGDASLYTEPTFRVQTRYGNGPWNGGTLTMKHRHEAISHARGIWARETYLFVRVIDSDDVVHWTNEEEQHAGPEGSGKG